MPPPLGKQDHPVFPVKAPREERMRKKSLEEMSRSSQFSNWKKGNEAFGDHLTMLCRLKVPREVTGSQMA